MERRAKNKTKKACDPFWRLCDIQMKNEGYFYMSSASASSLFQHQQMHVKTMWIIKWHLPSAGLSWGGLTQSGKLSFVLTNPHFRFQFLEMMDVCMAEGEKNHPKSSQSKVQKCLCWYGGMLVLMGGVTCTSVMAFIMLKNKYPALALYYIQLMCCYIVVEWLFKSLALAKQKHSICTFTQNVL